jgi:hypothetical protein
LAVFEHLFHPYPQEICGFGRRDVAFCRSSHWNLRGCDRPTANPDCCGPRLSEHGLASNTNKR